MPTIRQQAEHRRVSAARVAKPSLRVVSARKSAIEHIVETARPGEIIQVDDRDYYNNCLWHSYRDFS